MKIIRATIIPLLGITSFFFLNCGKDAPLGVSTTGLGGSGGQGIIVLGDSGIRPVGGGGASAVAPTGDAHCGAAISDLRQMPVDLLLVLDRSTSMSWDMGRDNVECLPTATNCQQRWSTVTRTLDQVLLSSSSTIHWGLKLFATPVTSGGEENCAVSPGVDVGVGASSATGIRDAIRATGPLGYTPTRQALQYAVQYLKTLVDQRQHHILLATDGDPNCDGASETVSAAVQVNHVVAEIESAVAADIKVHVLGLGPTTSLRNLEKFAVAGGTNHYYSATSADELITALSSIVGQVASCVFSLQSPPPDPANLAVYLDKQIVPRDGANGWSLASDLRSVLFLGAYCDGIKDGKFKQAEVYFGCPDSQPPITIP